MACKSKIEWDEKVSADLNEKWVKVMAEIRNLNAINSPDVIVIMKFRTLL